MRRPHTALTAAVNHTSNQARSAAAPFLAIGAGLAACAALLSFRLISQGDTFAWLAVGRWIAEHRAVPHVNLLMWTAPHFPWVAHAWGFALVLFCVYRVGGLAGTQALTLLAVLGAFLILLRLWRRMGANPALAPLPFLLALVLMADRISPRPELPTWVLLAATISLLFQWRARPSRAIWAK